LTFVIYLSYNPRMIVFDAATLILLSKINILEKFVFSLGVRSIFLTWRFLTDMDYLWLALYA
jgi:hypothetical protein